MDILAEWKIGEKIISGEKSINSCVAQQGGAEVRGDTGELPGVINTTNRWTERDPGEPGGNYHSCHDRKPSTELSCWLQW